MRLDLPQHVGNGSRWTQTDKHMQMIGYAINFEQISLFTANDPAHVRVETGPHAWINQRPTFLRAENEMIEQIAIGAWQSWSPAIKSVAPMGLYTVCRIMVPTGSRRWQKTAAPGGALSADRNRRTLARRNKQSVRAIPNRATA
jgi:hypothetical protein